MNKVPLKSLRRWIQIGHERKKGGGRKVRDPKMEVKLYYWYNCCKKKNFIVTPRMIKIKALSFTKLKDFNASKGWLAKFQNKYRLELYNIKKNKKKYKNCDMFEDKIALPNLDDEMDSNLKQNITNNVASKNNFTNNIKSYMSSNSDNNRNSNNIGSSTFNNTKYMGMNSINNNINDFGKLLHSNNNSIGNENIGQSSLPGSYYLINAKKAHSEPYYSHNNNNNNNNNRYNTSNINNASNNITGFNSINSINNINPGFININSLNNNQLLNQMQMSALYSNNLLSSGNINNNSINNNSKCKFKAFEPTTQNKLNMFNNNSFSNININNNSNSNPGKLSINNSGSSNKTSSFTKYVSNNKITIPQISNFDITNKQGKDSGDNSPYIFKDKDSHLQYSNKLINTIVVKEDNDNRDTSNYNEDNDVKVCRKPQQFEFKAPYSIKTNLTNTAQKAKSTDNNYNINSNTSITSPANKDTNIKNSIYKNESINNASKPISSKDLLNSFIASNCKQPFNNANNNNNTNIDSINNNKNNNISNN